MNGHSLVETTLYPGQSPGAAPAGCQVEFDVAVPAGYLWVMGDHRSVSEDSRCQEGRSGFVPEDAVVGRAVAVVLPFAHWAILEQPSEYQEVPSAARAAPRGAVERQ